jgi:hypothetical protein
MIKELYDKAPKRVQEIVDLIQSQQTDTACYSPTHSIFDDYNLNKTFFYTALINSEDWLSFLQDRHKQGHNQERFIDMVKEMVSVWDTLNRLMQYTDDELDQAECIFHGIE